MLEQKHERRPGTGAGTRAHRRPRLSRRWKIVPSAWVGRRRKQFRGDPTRWVSAEEFIRRGEEELPIARERMRKADRMLEDTQKELRDSRAVMEEMRERLKKADERAYAKARADLEEARTAAVQAAGTRLGSMPLKPASKR